MSVKRNYYRLEKNGFAEVAINKFHDELQAVADKWAEYMGKYNTDSLYGGDDIRGVKLNKDEVPEGWKNTRDLPRDYYRPLKKKECMSEYKEFNSLGSKPSGIQLCNALGVGLTFSGMSVSFPHYERINDELIMSLPEGSTIPSGTVLPALKMSEYWAIKESGS